MAPLQRHPCQWITLFVAIALLSQPSHASRSLSGGRGLRQELDTVCECATHNFGAQRCQDAVKARCSSNSQDGACQVTAALKEPAALVKTAAAAAWLKDTCWPSSSYQDGEFCACFQV